MQNLWSIKIETSQKFFCYLSAIVYSLLLQSSLVSAKESPLTSQKLETVRTDNYAIAQSLPNQCDSLNSSYEELYSFETRNHYISICSQRNRWFYIRQSKSEGDRYLLLPAQIVFGGDVFKAVKGKVTYFVGANSDGYYSSVMYGNNQMIFEPELSDVAVEIPQVSETPSETVETGNINPNDDYWTVCTQDRDDVHSYLSGWQRFIDRSYQNISEYAHAKGYKFRYINSDKTKASVETTNGLIVTLDIMELTEKIDRICVQSTAR